jgi:hypothetical protein
VGWCGLVYHEVIFSLNAAMGTAASIVSDSLK